MYFKDPPIRRAGERKGVLALSIVKRRAVSVKRKTRFRCHPPDVVLSFYSTRSTSPLSS